MEAQGLINRLLGSASPDVHTFDATTADYVAGLIAGLLNRAAIKWTFRGAIASHPHMSAGTAPKGTDIGYRRAYGLTATAQANWARITVKGADAGRLGFLSFTAVHRQMNGCAPGWNFEDPVAMMRTRATIVGVPLDVACFDISDGAAIELKLLEKA